MSAVVRRLRAPAGALLAVAGAAPGAGLLAGPGLVPGPPAVVARLGPRPFFIISTPLPFLFWGWRVLFGGAAPSLLVCRPGGGGVALGVRRRPGVARCAAGGRGRSVSLAWRPRRRRPVGRFLFSLGRWSGVLASYTPRGVRRPGPGPRRVLGFRRVKCRCLPSVRVPAFRSPWPCVAQGFRPWRAGTGEEGKEGLDKTMRP